jgi:hypothetical protein
MEWAECGLREAKVKRWGQDGNNSEDWKSVLNGTKNINASKAKE